MLRLRDIMATDVVAISSEATVREAMELLSRHHVSGAPVVNGSTLVGVVSATDLMEFAAALPAFRQSSIRAKNGTSRSTRHSMTRSIRRTSRGARSTPTCGKTRAPM